MPFAYMSVFGGILHLMCNFNMLLKVGRFILLFVSVKFFLLEKLLKIFNTYAFLIINGNWTHFIGMLILQESVLDTTVYSLLISLI